MRIVDQNGIELSDFDPKKGYLVDRQLFIKHHEAVEAVEEIGHYEVVVEYPNGGKDVEWVVDTPGVEAREAYDEYEDVQQFIPFTAVQLASQRIEELKQQLRDSDYHILKIVEGAITLQDCAEVIKKRASWRKEINDLERKHGL
jgi:hypothetical protein